MKFSKFFIGLIICFAIQLCVSDVSAVLCPHPSVCPCTLSPPAITIDPRNPLAVTFDIPRSYVMIKSVDFGDGEVLSDISVGSFEFSHIYKNPGTYTVTFNGECDYGCYTQTYNPDGSWYCWYGYEYPQVQTALTVGQSTHTITATASPGGTISPDGIVQVDDKTDQSFLIKQDQGYVIQDVVVDGISQGAISSYTFPNVVADHSIQATFIKTHTIITSIDGGTIDPSGNIQVLDGQDQAFSITPDQGYVIINVIVDGVSQGAISSYTFKKVISDHTIEVVCRNGCDFSTSSERCFGGVGNGCNGDAPGAPFTYHLDTCTVDGWMSAGSILHDRCCIETNNKGVKCSEWDLTDNRCQAEYDEAFANTACSASGSGPRQWAVTFGPYPAGNFGDFTQKDLRAPAGTRINPSYQYLCESGKCHTDKDGNTIKKLDGCGWYCECQGTAIAKPFTISIKCPVEVSITDPDGLTINKQINQITGASYSELGLGSDGTPDAKIGIPERKVGDYLITVTPKSGAAPTALFTLELSSDDSSPQNIVTNIPVNQIPSAPYKVHVTSDGDLVIIISSDIPVREFSSTFLPVSLIIGFLGIVLFIQRSREH